MTVFSSAWDGKYKDLGQVCNAPAATSDTEIQDDANTNSKHLVLCLWYVYVY